MIIDGDTTNPYGWARQRSGDAPEGVFHLPAELPGRPTAATEVSNAGFNRLNRFGGRSGGRAMSGLGAVTVPIHIPIRNGGGLVVQKVSAPTTSRVTLPGRSGNVIVAGQIPENTGNYPSKPNPPWGLKIPAPINPATGRPYQIIAAGVQTAQRRKRRLAPCCPSNTQGYSCFEEECTSPAGVVCSTNPNCSGSAGGGGTSLAVCTDPNTGLTYYCDQGDPYLNETAAGVYSPSSTAGTQCIDPNSGQSYPCGTQTMCTDPTTGAEYICGTSVAAGSWWDTPADDMIGGIPNWATVGVGALAAYLLFIRKK